MDPIERLARTVDRVRASLLSLEGDVALLAGALLVYLGESRLADGAGVLLIAAGLGCKFVGLGWAIEITRAERRAATPAASSPSSAGRR